MAETIKFTEEEVTEIREIQQNVLIIQNDLGQLELESFRLEQRFNAIRNAKSELMKKYEESVQKETTLSESLKQKYGVGTYDLETNTFTPVQ